MISVVEAIVVVVVVGGGGGGGGKDFREVFDFNMN